MSKYRRYFICIIFTIVLMIVCKACSNDPIDEIAPLPNFSSGSFKIVDSGKTESLLHPEWGIMESKLYAYSLVTGEKKIRNFIAVFFDSDGTYKYAEWVYEWTVQNKTEFLIRGYTYSGDEFIFEKCKKGPSDS